jgi:hypothetical protein
MRLEHLLPVRHPALPSLGPFAAVAKKRKKTIVAQRAAVLSVAASFARNPQSRSRLVRRRMKSAAAAS